MELYTGHRKVQLDPEGYVARFDDWDEEVAAAIAESEHVGPLDEPKLDILRFIRQYYDTHGSYPVFDAVCLNVRQERSCVSQKFMDPVTALKVAGIPNPGEEITSYLNREIV